MAKKGQKFRKYSEKEREEIVKKYLTGKYSYSTLAKEYKMSWNTVHTMVDKYKRSKENSTIKRGRPKKKELTREDYKETYEIIKKYWVFHRSQQKKK